MGEYLETGIILDSRYRITRVIGTGGFGIIYEAYNESVNRKVAIKELFDSEYMRRDGETVIVADETDQEKLEGEQKRFEKAKEKFLREARRLADFSSEPGIVHVLDYFEQNNTAYIVMEYLEGIGLDQYFHREGRIKAEDMFRMLLSVMRTLDKVHENGVIHRDISPDNIIMIGTENKELSAAELNLKLIDFGSARNYMDERTRTIELKDGYTPIEQIQNFGDNDLGPWTDIYALCAVAYRGITGEKPVNAISRSAKDSLLTPSAMGIKIEPKLENILMKGLSVWKQDRYQSIAEMLKDLDPLLNLKKEKVSNKKGKATLIFSCSIFLLAAISVFGWRYYQKYLPYFKFHGAKTETILLAPYDDMSIQEYQDAVKIIDQRMKYLAGEKNYILRERDQKIELIMPLEFFDKENIEKDINYTMRQITQPHRISLAVVVQNDSQNDDESASLINLNREDIVSLTKKKGNPSLLSYVPDSFSTSNDIYDGYIEIKITEDAAKRVKNKLGKYYGNENSYMLLLTDAGTKKRVKYGDFFTDSKGDWTTYYLRIHTKRKRSVWEAVLKTPELGEPFQVTYEIPVDWEEENNLWGKYQCRNDEIQEPAVSAEYRLFLFDTCDTNPGTGSWSELLYDLRKELDCLEKPYAIGFSLDDVTRVVVKIAQKDTNEFLQNLLLGVSSIAATDGNEELTIYKEQLVIQNNKGSYQIKYEPSKDNNKEDMEEWRKKVSKSGNDIVYLTVNGYKIASAELNKCSSGKLLFDKGFLGAEESFTKENLNLINLINSIQKMDSYYEKFRCRNIQYSSSENTVEMEPEIENKENMPRNDELKEIQTIVRQVNKNADVTMDIRAFSTEIIIKLNYKLSKSYASKVVADIEKILNNGQGIFKNCCVSFYPGCRDQEQNVRIIYPLSNDEQEEEPYLRYNYALNYDSEQLEMISQIERNTALQKYITDDSFKDNEEWWWYDYDALDW